MGLWGGCRSSHLSGSCLSNQMWTASYGLHVHKRWPECIECSPGASPPGLVSSKRTQFVVLGTVQVGAEAELVVRMLVGDPP